MKKNLQIAALLVFAGMFYAAYDIYTFRQEELPKMEQELRAKNAQINAKIDELKKLQSFAANIENVKQELNELNLQLESALEYMPRTFNLSSLLRKLNMLAQNSGVKILTFRPVRGEEKAPEGFYSITSIDFDIRGTFSQTLVFLDQISRLKRIVNLHSLKMGLENSNPAIMALGGPTIVATAASIKTYRFSE